MDEGCHSALSLESLVKIRVYGIIFAYEAKRVFLTGGDV